MIMSQLLVHENMAGRFRSEMPVCQRWVYLDHAAVAPLPSSSRAAIETWLTEATEQGDVLWPNWAEHVENVRRQFATLVNAEASEIALIPNTTAGIHLVAEGFPWQSGENVVVLANEFPSNLYPWMNLAARGVEARQVQVDGGRVDIQRIADACDERTRIVSASWVGYASGWRLDVKQLAELCHRRGVLFFLDAIQGLGVFPLDVRDSNVDFFAADGHKWLLGPEGAGVFYCKREHLALLRPLGVGWNSVKHASDYNRIELNLRDEARRYEGGSQNMVGMIGLGASLKLLQELGVSPRESPIAERVLAVTDYACARLQEIGAKLLSPRQQQHSSGIVTFTLPGHDPQRVRSALQDAGIVARCRGGGVRVSPHGYATAGDIDRTVATLVEIQRKGPPS